MIKWIKLTLVVAFFTAGIVFSYSAVVNTKPGFVKSENYYGTEYVLVSDISNPNKGSFVMAYAVLAAGCFVAGGLLLHPLKDRQA